MINTGFLVNRETLDTANVILLPAMQWLIGRGAGVGEAYETAADLEPEMIGAYFAAKVPGAEPFTVAAFMGAR